MKLFTTIAVAIFTIVAVVHLLRILLGWEVTIQGAVIPMWASYLGLLIAGGLAFQLWRETRESKTFVALLMTFQISNRRAIQGNDIFVKVTAQASESIARVETELDGFSIGEDELTPPHAMYQRNWFRQGSAGPGIPHTVTVRAMDEKGNVQAATHRWTDDV